MPDSPSAAPPATVPSLLRWMHAYRYLLGAAVLVLVAAGAWFAEDIGALFAHRPTAADVAGTWRFDAAEFARTIDGVAGKPAADGANTYRERLLELGKGYQGAAFTFRPDGYTRVRNGQQAEVRCTYAGVPTNLLVLRPEGADSAAPALSLVLDPQHGRIFVTEQELSIPFSKAP